MSSREGIADYDFLDTIGSGPHGTVYRARPPARLPVSDETVAVKVLTGSTSPAAFDRATEELRLWASMRSPYLAELFDTGRDSGTFYYAMAYYPAGSLGTPAAPLDRRTILRAVSHAARATHALHEVGCVHRDIKPSNILIHDEGAHLSDLGLAQILTPGQTVTGLGAVGAVEYLDPLVVRGGAAGRATDVFALGATLHHALAGTGIYPGLSGDDPIAALRTVIESEPEVDRRLPEADAALIAACLDPDPANRPATAEELCRRIEELTSP